MQTPTVHTIAEIAARYPEEPVNPEQRFNDFGTDVGFACHSRVLSKTFGNNAYRYVMSIPPATHGLDQMHYFYVGDGPESPPINVTIARQFQQYLRNFVVHGNPSGASNRGSTQNERGVPFPDSVGHTKDPSNIRFNDMPYGDPRRNNHEATNFKLHMEAGEVSRSSRDVSDGDWPTYGDESMIFNITANGFEIAKDYWSLDDRCKFIQSLIDNKSNGW